MSQAAIEVSNLSHVFPNGRGIRSVSFQVHAGEVLGYLGPNGAGKTTTMRHVTGLMRAQSGTCTVMDHDAWGEAPSVHALLGYVPGELNLMKGTTGLFGSGIGR